MFDPRLLFRRFALESTVDVVDPVEMAGRCSAAERPPDGARDGTVARRLSIVRSVLFSPSMFGDYPVCPCRTARMLRLSHTAPLPERLFLVLGEPFGGRSAVLLEDVWHLRLLGRSQK